MDIGISVMYWPWFTPDEQVTLAQQADRLGLHSVWVAEGYGQDAASLLGLLAGATERILLGAGVMQIPARPPTAAASTASTIDRLSGGRMLLGLGLSGPQVSEGWYGVPFTNGLRRTREYLEIVRLALAGKRVSYDGREFPLPLREGGLGLGKALKLMGPPERGSIPIYLGVGGERTVEQAGEIADGWTPFLFSPEHADTLLAPLRRGLARAGRDRREVTVAPLVPAAVADDLDAARAAVRPVLTLYFGGMGSREQNFYVDLAERYGHGESARACQRAYLAGDRSAAAEAISDELCDLAAIVATPDSLPKRLSAFADAEVDVLVVVPFGDRPALVASLAEQLPALRREGRS